MNAKPTLTTAHHPLAHLVPFLCQALASYLPWEAFPVSLR